MKSNVRSTSSIVFGLLLLLAVGIIFIAAFGINSPKVRLMPFVIGIPVLIMIIWLLLLDIFPNMKNKILPKKSKPEPNNDDLMPGEDSNGKEAQKRIIHFTLWIIGFYILSYFFGMMVIVPIVLFFLYKVLNREGWIMSIGLSIGTSVIIYVLFGLILDVF